MWWFEEEKKHFYEGVLSHLSKTNSQAEWFSLKGDPRLLIVKCKRRSPVGRCVRQCAPLQTLSASMSFSCIPCLALRFKLPPSAILISQQMHHLKWWQGIFWICGHTRHPSCHCRLGCRVSLLATTCFCTELPRSKVFSRTERRGDTRINVLTLQRSQQLRLPHSHFDTLVRLVSQPLDSVFRLSATQIQVVWAVLCCMKLQSYVQLQKLIHPHPFLFFWLGNNKQTSHKGKDGWNGKIINAKITNSFPVLCWAWTIFFYPYTYSVTHIHFLFIALIAATAGPTLAQINWIHFLSSVIDQLSTGGWQCQPL